MANRRFGDAALLRRDSTARSRPRGRGIYQRVGSQPRFELPARRHELLDRGHLHGSMGASVRSSSIRAWRCAPRWACTHRRRHRRGQRFLSHYVDQVAPLGVLPPFGHHFRPRRALRTELFLLRLPPRLPRPPAFHPLSADGTRIRLLHHRPHGHSVGAPWLWREIQTPTSTQRRPRLDHALLALRPTRRIRRTARIEKRFLQKSRSPRTPTGDHHLRLFAAVPTCNKAD